jgi:hypothetical protein
VPEGRLGFLRMNLKDGERRNGNRNGHERVRIEENEVNYRKGTGM